MTAEQLYALLVSLGVDLTGISVESLDSSVSETVTLKKFSSDGLDDRTDPPVETIVIKDGVVMEKIV